MWLLAEMTLREKLVDAMTVTIVGMGIVFASLFLMGELFVLIGRLLGAIDNAASAGGDTAEQRTPDKPQSDPVDPKLIAVLTAAAMAATGRAVVIRQVRFINRNTVSGWSEAGRSAIHSSHEPRKAR
jgi:glutaconyl-CoA/methylmalonyl-CoA decarboxylase subunit delta